MKSSRRSAIRRMAVVCLCAVALFILPGTSVWATARALSARTLGFVGRTIAPAFGMSPASPPAPSITATMAGALAVDNDSDGKADPNDIIRYTTTITNGGPDPATGVQLTAIADAKTTLVPGSTVISPLAINEAYASVGNMTLTSSSIGPDCTTPLRSVTCNDTLNGGSLTRFGDTQANAGNTIVNGTNTVTTVNLGTVTLSTNGTFVYNPAAGFEGDDEFWYTLTNSTVTPNLTDTGKVTITVGGTSGMVWFVNSTGGAGTGRQSAPFNSLSAINAINNGTGTNPAAGDTIFLLENGTAYSGQLTLLNTQRLITQDTALAPSALNGPATQPGNAYPANSAGSVSITGAGAGAPTIVLGSGNTIAHFTIGHTNGAFAISGATAGSVSVRQVTINSAGGGGLGISTSGSFVNDATFTGFNSITATGGTNGVLLTGLTGTFTVNTGALSGATGSEFVVSGGNAAITYNGTINHGTAGQRMITVSDTTGGSVSFNNGGTPAYISGGTGILIDGAAGNFTITGADLNGTRGIEILGDTTNNATGTFTFNNVTIDTVAGATNHGFIVNGDVSGVAGNDVTGVIDLNNVDITNSGGNLVNIAGLGGGSIDFDSASALVRGSAGLGMVATSNAGGTITFNSSTKTLNTGTNTAVDLTSNTGAIINFVNGGLAITTTNGVGFSATGGGTVNVTTGASPNTIASSAGTALNISSTAIGGGGVTLQSVSAAGAANGIVLSGTGTGAFTITGVGTTNASGGTIQNISTRGININSASNVTLKNIALVNANNSIDAGGAGVCDDLNLTACNAAIYLGDVTGATLDNVDVSGTMVENGLTLVNVSNFSFLNSTVTNAGDEVHESGIEAFNLSGTCFITNSDISFSETDSLAILNNDVSVNLTISGSTFRDSQTVSSGGATNGNGEGGLQFRSFSRSPLTGGAQSGGNVPVSTINIVNSSFLRLRTQGIQVFSLDDSVLNLDITGSTIDAQSDIGTSIDLNASGTSTFSFNVLNNPTIQSRGGGAVNITSFDTGHIEGRINNNSDIEVLGSAGIPVRLVAQDQSSMVVEINGNTVSNVNGTEDTAIDVQSRFQTARVDVAIINNTVTGEPTGVAGINLISGSSTAGESNITCASVANNNVTNAVGNTIRAFRVRNSDISNTNRLYLQGFTTDTATTWINRGNIPADATEVAVSVTGSGISPLAPPGGVCNTVDTLSDFADASLGSLDTMNADNVSKAFGRGGGSFARTRITSGLRSAVASRLVTAGSTARSSAAAAMGRVRGVVAALGAAGRVARIAVVGRVQKVVASATEALIAPLYASGETVNVPLGTLPAGKSITVVFTVTVDSPPVAEYTTHATISSATASFGDVDSNTVTTNGDRYNSSNTLVSSPNPSDELSPVTFTATVEAIEGPGTPTPDGTVQFLNGVTPIGSPAACNPKPGFVSQCTATLITSSLPVGTNSITANYLGGTNYDPSTSTNTISQVVNACTVNPIVTTNADSGAGSLRQAIADACGASGSNVITFNMGSVVSPITLTSAELAPTRNVVINGPGAKALTITRDAGAGAFRIFHVGSGRSFAISGVTVSNGFANAGGLGNYGGGLYSEENSSVTITAAAFTGHSAEYGGGVAARTAGSALSLTIVDSTFSGNTASGTGGGVLAASAVGGGFGVATLTMTNTTVSGNVASIAGGGMDVSGSASGTITNSTIAGNSIPSAGIRGGGINVDSSATALLRNTIVANNTEGSGPLTPSDVKGALDGTSANNLIGSPNFMTGVTNGVNGNQVGVDPLLGPLADNGGPTQTRALLKGSPAIDAGDSTFVVAPPFTSASPITDQRGSGFRRVADGPDADSTATADIGALEAQPTIEDIADKATNEDAQLAFSFNVGDATVGFDSITATSSDTAVAAHPVVSGSGSSRTLTITPAVDASGTATITVTATKTIGGTLLSASDTFLLTVLPINDTPTLALIPNPAAIPEDSGEQTVNLSGISAGAGEVQALTVTATSSNQALIPDPTVTYSSPGATGSLAYTPVANAFGTAIITVTVQDNGGTLNGSVDTVVRTFTVTVNAVADTASITNATTAEDVQTTSGLVVSRNASDGAEVTHVKITNIQNGTLFLNNGVTQVAAGSFITFAQANAGLKFTGAPNFFGSASFDVQASTSGADAGLGGGVVTATITVTAVADFPLVTAATTKAQVQTTSGLVITPSAVDGAEVTHYKISAITNGAVFLNDGTTPIANDAFITVAQGAAGLKFTPANGFAGAATFQVHGALDNTGTGLGGAATATVTVQKYATTTTLTSANPNPSDQIQPITVVYTVLSAESGPTPTGNVLVTISGGPETCTGTVAAGQCTLTPTIAGVRDVQATYLGDAINNTSASSLLSHTVSTCTANPVVVTTTPSGAGSLIDAVGSACFGSTVTFTIPGGGPHTITLNNFTLDIAKDLTIRGSSNGIRISGGNLTPILLVEVGVSAVLDGLTLLDGSGVFGGALINNGTLTIQNSTLSGNTATFGGGAILNSGALTVTNSTLSGNTANSGSGGAIDSSGGTSLTLTNVTITGNTVLGGGSSGGGVVTGPLTTIGNSIIAGNTAASASNVSGSFTTAGTNVLSGDPMLGALQNNGGPTFTHTPLAGSPALDAGDNTVAAGANLTTDQRGMPFARVLDAADADTTPTVDIGAVEAIGVLQPLGDAAIDEDTVFQVTFNVGDGTTVFDSILASSSNTALVPNGVGNVDLTGTGSTRTLTLTPVVNASGTTTVTVVATKTVGGVPQSSAVTFTLTVNAVNDLPTLDAVSSPAAILEDAGQQTISLSGISTGAGEIQTLTVTATSNNTALIPNPSVTYSTGSTGSLAYTPVANANGSAVITVTVNDGFAVVSRTFVVTVNAVADTPAVTNATTTEDAQTTSGLVITRNAADGSEVTHFKITNITGGTLFQHDGTTPIVNGGFITVAQGNAGLAFTPAPNAFATGHFTVQASIGTTDAGLGGGTVTADITVSAVAEMPGVTDATTTEDIQTATGLVLSRNGADGAEVTHFKVTAITGGTLFQNDGATSIASGDSITFAQGNAGLRFTPAPNTFGTGTFAVQAATSATGAGLSSPVTATITVTAVADTPSITNATTTANTQTTAGLVVSRNAADGAEVTHVKIVLLTGGTLFQADGTTPIAIGSFITVPQAAAGLRLTPIPDSLAVGRVTIRASIGATDAGLGGNEVTADVTVTKIPSTTTLTSSLTPSAPGQTVTFTATVTPTAAATGGTVQFRDGTTALGAPVTLTGGVATFTTAALLPGVHQVTAEFSGSALYLGSTGTVTQAVTSGRTVTTGAGEGGAPRVRRFGGLDGSPDDGPLTSYFAFATAFSGGVRVAEADINGDGVADVISGAGAGGPAQVVIHDGATGGILSSFFAYDASFTGGVYVAAGDVDGDGRADIITGQGGGASQVRVFSGASGAPIKGFTPFTPSFTGGVRVAAGDVDGDGRADIITGAGSGGDAMVHVFSGATDERLKAFSAYPGFTGGVYVAAGDVNGDGYADVITGAGEGGGAHVIVFDGQSGATLRSFFAAAPPFAGGVRVAAGDVNGDGRADIITGLGPGGNAQVGVFDGTSGAVLNTFNAFEGFSGGVFVATAVPETRAVIDAPANGTTVRENFRIAGWAILENAAGGTGVDAIHVYAYPITGGAPMFLGAAVLGDPRPDVAAIFGEGYLLSGYHLDVTGLSEGTYDIRTFIRDASTRRFNTVRTTRVTVRVPVNDIRMTVDLPRADASVRPALRIAGWVLETGGTPIEVVHVWSVSPGAVAPVFLGVASLGDARPDVAAAFGPSFATAGFHLDVTGLADGPHTLLLFPKALGAPGFAAAQAVRITVETPVPTVLANVDLPRPGPTPGSFLLAGWALTLNAPTAPGIDVIHAWAYPVGGGAPRFLGVPALGGRRPDIASVYGAQYETSGFNLAVQNLPSGTWDIVVSIWPTGATTFTTARVVRVTVQ